MKATTTRPDLNLEEKNRWFVIANQTSVTFYSEPGDQKFHFVDRFTNEAGREHEGDLDSDRSGRSDSSTSPGSHSLDRRHHKHEEIARRWAARISSRLNEASLKNEFEEVVLVAAPHFLGVLREELPATLLKKVIAQIPKEYNQGSDTEIREHVFEALAKISQ